jgi:Family of unknown function (DUF6325)
MGNNDDLDELGPVDWIVVEFPGSRFNGQIAPALRDLVERDLIRVLDLVVLKKDSDGSLEAFELSDLDEGEIGELQSYEAQLAMLLSEDDVNAIAAAIEPGSSECGHWPRADRRCGVRPRRMPGQTTHAPRRDPTQALLAAIEADEQEGESADKEGD